MGFQELGKFTGGIGRITRDHFFRKPVVFYDKVTFEWATNRIVIEDGTIKGFTAITGADIISDNWDGTVPLDLSSEDTGASAGYALDGSVGSMQLEGNLFLGGSVSVTDGDIFSGTQGSTDHYLAIGATFGARFIGWKKGSATRATIGVGTGTPATMTFDSNVVDSTLAYEFFGNSDTPGRGFADIYVGWRGKSTHADGQMQWQSGVVGAPGYAFLNDPDTGMWNSSADTIDFSLGGAQFLRVSVDYVRFGNNVTTGVPAVKQIAGTAALPGFSFIGDSGTGIYRRTTNQLGLAAGGVDVVAITTTTMHLITHTTTGNAANMFMPSGGQISRFTSSRRWKSDIDYDTDWMADLELKPVTFYREDDDDHYMGFIAEDVEELDSRMGVYEEDGQVDSYDMPGVVAVLAAKVRRLEKHLTRCQNCDRMTKPTTRGDTHATE